MIETNHAKIAKRLEKRGWKKQHINRTIHILKKAESVKHPSIKKLDKMMFWLFLAMFIAISSILFIGILPILVALPSAWHVFVILVLGLCIGMFSDYLLRHIDIEKWQYLLAIALLPVVNLAVFILVITLAKNMLNELGVFFSVNPLLVICAYTAAYSLPHIIHKMRKDGTA